MEQQHVEPQIHVDLDGKVEDGRQQLVENDQQPIVAQDEQHPECAIRKSIWMTNYEVSKSKMEEGNGL
ncbi:hypothetical protein CK203_018323 [Vitis vinifera]|uniref:Uncharacterized protein n=1 Tax=Vitis vinifera TaxID=29760 RepID=A0A438JP04_VITVI|nr:hypothetical protein CK203_018323 [Vitis vinifera]